MHMETENWLSTITVLHLQDGPARCRILSLQSPAERPNNHLNLPHSCLQWREFVRKKTNSPAERPDPAFLKRIRSVALPRFRRPRFLIALAAAVLLTAASAGLFFIERPVTPR
jgi:hypothetical protein